MEFFKHDVLIDFMRYRRPVIAASVIAMVAAIGLIFWPGPNYGIDFRGGTELQLEFKGNVEVQELRSALTSLGYHQPDVVSVSGRANQYIVRVGEHTVVSAQQGERIKQSLRSALPSGVSLRQFRVARGGDKVAFQLSGDVPVEALKTAIDASGVKVRLVTAFGRASDYKFEAQLVGVGDRVIEGLKTKLGARAPDAPLRVEWVGPKAGEQLRDAAVKSLLYAIAFIMTYVAFRFDLRFAPGGVLALLHDALFTIGVLIILQKEINLTTVAAILTVVGYSINDTIVIYDRIRENMQRMRTKSLHELINISTSQTLSRTILTATTVLISLAAFFVWGTPVIRDFALALFIGVMVGTYSSIYIAAPMTEWMDKRFFRRTHAT